MSTRKYQGEDIVLSVDMGATNTGVTDFVCDITDIAGTAIATIPLIEAGTGSGSYRGAHTTAQIGTHHCRIHSASLAVDEAGVYDVRPTSEAPATVAATLQTLGKQVVSVSFA